MASKIPKMIVTEKFKEIATTEIRKQVCDVVRRQIGTFTIGDIIHELGERGNSVDIIDVERVLLVLEHNYFVKVTGFVDPQKRERIGKKYILV